MYWILRFIVSGGAAVGHHPYPCRLSSESENIEWKSAAIHTPFFRLQWVAFLRGTRLEYR